MDRIRVSTHSRPKAAGSSWSSRWAWKLFQHTAARRRLAYPLGMLFDELGFNTQPPEGGWQGFDVARLHQRGFNTQPPEGGWGCQCCKATMRVVSTHSRPKAAGLFILYCYFLFIVSTHSRPKAAGIGRGNADRLPRRFNTQPPEGGWPSWVVVVRTQKVFQHTAARRRLGLNLKPIWFSEIVSTHSRPKAAGRSKRMGLRFLTVSTHSRPKAAGCFFCGSCDSSKVSTHSRPKAAGMGARAVLSSRNVSTHSRPKAAGQTKGSNSSFFSVSTHSRPKAAGSVFIVNSGIPSMFQHTAARRRLVFNFGIRHIFTRVSTHSRPKAAG